MVAVIIDGFEIACKACQEVFWICRPCFRGHRYCSDFCRAYGRKQSQKISKRKYEQSLEARADHRERQQAYRERRKAFFNSDKSVTEHCIATSNISVEAQIQVAPRKKHCVCCGERRYLKLRGGNIEEKENRS